VSGWQVKLCDPLAIAGHIWACLAMGSSHNRALYKRSITFTLLYTPAGCGVAGCVIMHYRLKCHNWIEGLFTESQAVRQVYIHYYTVWNFHSYWLIFRSCAETHRGIHFLCSWYFVCWHLPCVLVLLISTHDERSHYWGCYWETCPKETQWNCWTEVSAVAWSYRSLACGCASWLSQ